MAVSDHQLGHGLQPLGRLLAHRLVQFPVPPLALAAAIGDHSTMRALPVLLDCCTAQLTARYTPRVSLLSEQLKTRQIEMQQIEKQWQLRNRMGGVPCIDVIVVLHKPVHVIGDVEEQRGSLECLPVCTRT